MRRVDIDFSGEKMRPIIFKGLTVAFFAFSLSAFAQDQAAPPLRPADLANADIQAQIAVLPETPERPFLANDGPDNSERAQSTELRVKRSRTVTVNAGFVTRMLDAPPLRLSREGKVSDSSSQQIFNIFDDLDVRIVKLAMDRNELGLTVWRGAVVGDPMGSATIIVDKNEITARITTQDKQVTIFPIGGGLHKVREITGRSSAEHGNDAVRPPKPTDDAPAQSVPESSTHEKSSATTYTLRVLVAYTPQALVDIPNMASAISLAIADLNTTFTNSAISAQAQLVGLEKVSYTEGSSSDSTILNAATNGTGDFSRIKDMRAVVQADIVAVIAHYATTSCGLGWINDDIDQFPNSLSSYLKYGTSLTNSNGGCLPETFTHETGHNMGANHDRYQIGSSAVAGPAGYNYGYVDTVNKFQDVMSYRDECESLNITCAEIQYYSNPDVNYNGHPVGVADSQADAANNSRKIREMLPYIVQFHGLLSQPTTPMLAVFINGTGTVTSSSGGLSCTGGGSGACAANISGGGNVTLTPVAPAGWQFTGWSGACSGTGSCAVTMSTSRNVQATFAPSLRLATVYSSAQTTAQSFLRFVNTGSSAATVNVALADYATGQILGTWTSSSIGAGVALQVQINTVESALPSGTSKPQYYAAAIQSNMTGYIQHVLYRPADGTLTNLSTCDSGVTANSTQVANVHSTLLDYGFPSSIALTNTGSSSSTATLGIYDSTTGVKLGTYTSSSIPSGAQAIISIASIESSTGVKPTSVQYHYTIKVENSFTGSIQHLVNNLQRGVITDMTTICAFGTLTSPPSTLAVRQPGPIFSSAQSASQSFLRFYNTGTSAGTVNLTLENYTTGQSLGSWTSPSIPAGASAQYQITTPESAVSGSKPQYYATLLQSQISGYFQHVLYRPADGTLTNLSTCEYGVTASPSQLINVHSSLLDFGYGSSVVISNPTSSAFTASLGVYDARNGTKFGTYTTPSVPAGGRLILPIATIQSGIGYTPASDVYHYVIKAEGTFNGFLQHLVNNSTAGVITDMTTMCQLPALAVKYTDCYPSSCSISLGTAAQGQIKKPGGGYENFRLSLTAGQTYSIDVKGSSTNNGTLVRPYIYLYGPSGTVVKQGGGGGTGTDAHLTYTPTTTGNHTIQVTVYIYDNNAGSFTVTVN